MHKKDVGTFDWLVIFDDLLENLRDIRLVIWREIEVALELLEDH